MSDMIPAQTINQLAAAYNQAQKSLNTAHALIEEADEAIQANFDARGASFTLRSAYGRHSEAIDALHRDAWAYVIKLTNIVNLLTPSRTAELNRQVEENDLPPFTAANIKCTLDELRQNMATYMTEAVQEVYDWLRPRQSDYRTNSEYEAGTKVILMGVISVYTYPDKSARAQVTTYAEARLRALDNVFSILAGGSVIEYPGDLLTVIRDAMQQNRWECETDRFRCKWFKAETMHIWIKDRDALYELNRIAGGGMIKPPQASASKDGT